MLHDIDFLFPTETYSIHEFVQRAALLSSEEHPDKSAFATFVLTGRFEDHQAVLDPLQHTIPPDQDVTLKRDYDSLIGISSNIVVQSEIFVSPVARQEHTLTENVHLQVDVRHRDTVSLYSSPPPITYSRVV
jgi:hypothetical protein